MNGEAEVDNGQKVYGKAGFCVVPEIDRPPKAIIEQLAEFPVSIIGDGMGRRGIMDPGLKALNLDVKMCGPAVTVETRAADNLMVHAALKLAQPGDVIVVNAHGDLSAGIWGEITTRMAIRKGLAGLVMDGSVRDSRELAASGFPVFCRGVSPCGGGKEGTGQVNLPICCGGVPVHPGDIIVGDADGLVVVPRAMAEEAITAARKRIDIERRRMDAIAGDDPEAIYPSWLIPTLRAKGVLGENETL
jgi:regulator of RNase E activity RraA